MYPRNAASPPRISIGPVVQISDGAVQASGCTVRILAEGGAEGDGGGTTAYSTDGVVLYTPTQAETNYTAFVLIAKKTGCIPATVTVVTTASAVAGNVQLAAAQPATTFATLTVTGATALSGGLTTTTIAASGAVTLGAALTVTGTTTLAAITQVGAVSLGATTIASLGVTGTVTFAALTVTNALTVSNGIIVSASTASRPGISFTGGSAAAGILATGGATSGSGVSFVGTGSGHGMLLTPGGTGKGLSAASVGVGTFTGTAIALTGATTLTGAVSMPAGLAANITGNITGTLATVTTLTNKTGFGLAADGLDSITVTEPATKPTTFRGWVMWLVQRFRRASKTPTTILTLTEAGATVTTQTVTDDSAGTETLGPPT